MANTTITDTDVNSGDSINLLGAEITWSFQNFVTASAAPGKSTSLSWENRLAKADYRGHENPIFTINGGFDSDDDTSDNITLNLLKDLATSGNTKYLYDDIFANTDDYASGMPIQIISIKASRSTDSEDGHYINYNIEFVEVQT